MSTQPEADPAQTEQSTQGVIASEASSPSTQQEVGESDRPTEDAGEQPAERGRRKKATTKDPDWVQGGGPKRLGDTSDKDMVVIKTLSPTPPAGVITGAGGRAQVNKPKAHPLAEDREVTARINKVLAGFPGFAAKAVETAHKDSGIGVFSGDDTRPVCALFLSPGGAFSLSGYAFASTRIVDGIIKPIMKEFGLSRFDPYTNRP